MTGVSRVHIQRPCGTDNIVDDAVTLAKLANGTQGDILYYGAGGEPARLPAGVSGHVLTTQGTGFNPIWAAAPPGGGLPGGTAGQTLRHDGLNWISNSFLYNNGSAIGIGTTNPLSKLHIGGDPSLVSSVRLNDSGILVYARSKGSDGIIQIEAQDGDQDPILRFAANAPLEYWTLGMDDSDGDKFKIGRGATLGTDDFMTIDEAGKFGLGTTVPASKLGVVGNLAVGATYGSMAAAVNGAIIEGKVGIKTPSPTYDLTVNGTLGIIESGVSPIYHTIIQGGDQTANITYTLPAVQGAANTYLKNDGAGVLSWAPGTVAEKWELLDEWVAPDNTYESYTLSGIASGYKRFLVVLIIKADNLPYEVVMRFNNDSGNNYDRACLQVQGSTLTGISSANTYFYASGGDNSMYSTYWSYNIFEIDNTTQPTTKGIRSTYYGRHYDTYVVSGGHWKNTTAEINRIDLFTLLAGRKWAANTTIRIWGLKG